MGSVIRSEVWRGAVLRFLSLGCWRTSGEDSRSQWEIRIRHVDKDVYGPLLYIAICFPPKGK